MIGEFIPHSNRYTSPGGVTVLDEFQRPHADHYMTDGEHVVVVDYQGWKGSARCHPDDDFDFQLGYTLAMSRALDKKAADLDHRAKRMRRTVYDKINAKEKR